MSTVHTVRPGTMTAAYQTTSMHDQLAAMHDDLEPIIKHAPKLVSLTELLAEKDHEMRRDMLRSFISSLNIRLVNAALRVITERRIRDEQGLPSIDQRNEADDEAGQNSGCFDGKTLDEVSAEYAGNRRPMSAAEEFKRLAAIRNFALACEEAVHPSTFIPYAPRPVADTIKFMCTSYAPERSASDPGIRACAAAIGADPELMAELATITDKSTAERRIARLKTHADEIVTEIDSMTVGEYDEQAIEEIFDSLPAQTQWNLYVSAANSVAKAFTAAFQGAMRGRPECISALAISRDLHARAMNTLEQLADDHAADLADAASRGAFLAQPKQMPRLTK